MILLPWLDRLFSYLLGLAAWGLWIGRDPSAPVDWEHLGGLSLWLALLSAPVLIALHYRNASRHTGEDH